jgi:outer membrane protein assembly factor BamB
VSRDNRLYALKPDGTLKWSFPLDAGGDSPPTVGDDGTIYVGGWRNYVPSAVDLNLYALNPDGTVKWAYKANGVVYTPVVGSDGTVYVRTGGATLNAIDSGGHEKWRAPVDIYMRSAPALASDGTVYVGTGQSTLSALDPASGKTKWTFYRSDLCSECSPSVGGDGTIYMIGFERRVYAIAPDGSERWTFPVDADHTGPEDAIAIGSDGTLYVGSQGDTLYAIGR